MINQELNTEAVVKYGGLSNAELMLVYFRFKKYLDNLNKNLDQRKVSKQIDTPMGTATAIMEVPQSHVDKFKETEYYRLTCNVVDKLTPVIDLLIDCDPSLQRLADELR